MLDAKGLNVTTAFSRAALEMKSWLPEHKSGEGSLKLQGRELPRAVGATLPGPLHVLCVAPGELLLVSDEETATSIAERMASELTAQGAVLVDATAGVGTLSISGRWAREVLSNGCGLDLHLQVLPIGRCARTRFARTRFAQVPVIVGHIDDTPCFRLYISRSYLRFLADWVADAAVEFDVST